GLATVVAGVLIRRPGRGPLWPTLAALAVLLVGFVQSMLGGSGDLALHVPMGVALTALATWLTAWSWTRRPTARWPVWSTRSSNGVTRGTDRPTTRDRHARRPRPRLRSHPVRALDQPRHRAHPRQPLHDHAALPDQGPTRRSRLRDRPRPPPCLGDCG